MTKDEAINKVISLARNEVGYCEVGDNNVKYNKGTWDDELYGWNTENQPWCDIFVDWLFIENFGLDKGAKMTFQFKGCCGASCNESSQYYRNNGAFYRDPKVGDQIFFYYNGGINHTGIVERVEGSQVVTIEGNSSDQVRRNFYQLNNSIIAGYGRPNWDIATYEDSDEEYVIPSPDIPYEETTVTVQPIVLAQYREEGVHICRPSEVSYYVWAMQYLLKENGYDVQADGYYANGTAKYVLQFQNDRGLEVDALCGENTWAELYKGITLMITNEGYAVRALQYLLMAHEYFIYADSIFGSQTYSQLVRFQNARGVVPSSGICAKSSWDELVKG